LRTPESYSDAFYVLAEAGILNPKEAEEFADMANLGMFWHTLTPK